MAHLIDKDALLAEIEKYYNECLKRAKITDPDYWNAKADAYRNVLAILDDILEVKEVGSMQKELKKCMYTNEHYTDEDRKVLCEDCEEECKYSKKEEPVSEDLERAADNCYFHNHAYARESFIEGAKWQKEQFENNRLKHCNSITNEQAELEQGFVGQHLDKNKRIPTFLDAIEYGMKLQKEQMMAKAIDATIEEPEPLLWRVLCELEGLFVAENNLHDGDGVKVIIIKED